MKSSLVAGNVRGGGTPSYDECGPNPIESLDYNVIIYPATCALSGQTAHVNAVDLPFFHLGERTSLGGFAQLRGPNNGENADQIPPANCTNAGGVPLLVDQRGYARSDGACDIGAYEANAARRVDPAIGVELLRNTGAAGDELGIAYPQLFVLDAPYWALFTSDGVIQIGYGTVAPGSDYPGTAAAPAVGGAYFFAGAGHETSTRWQQIDVSAAAAEIDAGTLQYNLSGWFGGSGSIEGVATLSVQFLAPAGSLGIDAIGGFGAAARGNATKLLRDAKSGFVPVGTRSLAVFLNADPTGFADALSVTLPEPDAVAAALVVIAVLLRRRGAT
jgi:hypothetical protein